MQLPRRGFLRLAASAAALPVVPRVAAAQPYPSRPVRLVAGFPGGSAPDLVARLLGQWLSDSLGQPFVIENRPGAASNIATEAVVRSAPDGHTLQMTVLTNVFNTALYTNLNFVFADHITHIAGVANAPYVIIVPPSFAARTVSEFVAYAKANPGKINFASGGRGSSTHIFGELFRTMAGVDLVHVPYRANYMPDLLSNQVQLAINPIPQALSLIRDGKLTVLAVTTKQRLATLSDIPTAAESVPGYEAIGWYGLGGPKGMPADIVATLNAATNKALADPKFKARLADLGIEPMPMTPGEFVTFIGSETAKWTKVIKAAGVVLE
ncbi:MAG: tripartite tricarboxylate transporter substrate binding protein [Xanthobacteraceae bacterium]|nr:tripartite tricarboxylate transporter substrate binding protein [Xanthobacteraceae bacterium]